MGGADFSPGNRSSVPSKIRCESAIVVSSGFPITLPSMPFPFRRSVSAADPGRLRVDEHDRAERLGLRPEGMKPWVGELVAGDAAADRRAAESHRLHRVLELLRGEVRELKRDRRKRRKPIAMARAEGGHRVVLNSNHLRAEIALDVVPVRVDAEDGDVDPLRVHRGNPLIERLTVEAEQRRLRGTRRRRRSTEQFVGRRYRAVGVDVDRSDAPTANEHRTAGRRRPLRGLRRAGHAASDKHQASSGGIFQKGATVGPHNLRLLTFNF